MMPEDEGIFGDEWEQQMGRILSRCGWQRYGAGKGDFACERCRGIGTGRHGLDGVHFHEPAYGDEDRLVLLEAKTRKWSTLSPSALQDWADALLVKLEHCNDSPDFNHRFGVPTDAFVTDAILCCWVHEGDYNAQRMDDWLCQLDCRSKGTPRRIWFLHNERICWVTAVLDAAEECQDNVPQELLFWSPAQGGLSGRKQQGLALEHMFSDVVFAKGIETADSRAGTVRHHHYAFYRGHFDALAASYLYQTMLSFNLDDCNTVTLYRVDNELYARDADAEFQRLWRTSNSKPSVECRPLRPANELPRWVDAR